MSRFVLVTSDADFTSRVRTAISGGLSGNLRTMEAAALPETPAELLGAVPGEPTEVVLLGPGVVLDDALKLAGLFDVQRPEISVVLVTESDPELALSAMRAGIRDILDPAADTDIIRVLLERACRTAQNRQRVVHGTGAASQGPLGKVIVVASPKGGVGKTTIATNLAVALGRKTPMSTVLVDLDTQFGDVASALKLEPEHTLSDAVASAARQDTMVLKAYLSVHPSSIYALCAPLSPADADEIKSEDIAHLIKQLASEFQYVVIDTAPGVGEHTLAALESATDALLICSMDVPSVRGLRKEFDVLRDVQLMPQNRHVLVNFADRSSGLSIRDIEATIGVTVSAVVPRSKQLAMSTNSGEPLLQQTSRGRIAVTLQDVADLFDPSRPARKGAHRRMRLT